MHDETWADIKDDTSAIIECGDRWKAVATKIGCRLHGFNDGASASFITPDGNVIEIGLKFRTALSRTLPPANTEADVERWAEALWKASGGRLQLGSPAVAGEDIENDVSWADWNAYAERYPASLAKISETYRSVAAKLAALATPQQVKEEDRHG